MPRQLSPAARRAGARRLSRHKNHNGENLCPRTAVWGGGPRILRPPLVVLMIIRRSWIICVLRVLLEYHPRIPKKVRS